MATPDEILNFGSEDGQGKFDLQMSRPGDADWTLVTLAQLESGFNESPYYFTNATNDAVVMHIDLDAPQLGGAPRIEFREKEQDGVTNKAFDPFTGTHKLFFRFKINHVPAADGGCVFAQVHNGNNDILSLRTQLVSGTLRMRFRVMGASITTNLTYAIGTEIFGMIEIVNGAWRLFYNDLVTPAFTSVAAGGTSPNITRTGQVSNSSYYCKGGAYPQSSTDPGTEYAEVEYKEFWAWHTGDPEPGSNLSGGGGGSGLPATVREVVSNSSSGLSGNLSVTTSSSTAVGDTLVVWEMREYGAPGDMPNPTGTAGTWTSRIATPIDNVALSCWTRPVTVAGAQTVTVTGNSDTPGCVLVAVVVKDCTAVGNAAGANSTTSSTTHTAPTVTAVDSNELLLSAWASSEEENYTPPGTMTSIVTPTTGVDGGTFVTMLVASQALTSSGATGTRVATGDASAAQATGSILLRGSTAPPPKAPLLVPRLRRLRHLLVR